MFYKTDLGGFVRSDLYDFSEIMGFNDTGLLSIFYSYEPLSSLKIFHYDDKNSQLFTSTFNVTSLQMVCNPDDDFVRIVPTSHVSGFLTLPKQNSVLDEKGKPVSPEKGTTIFINHEIKWDNPINLYGIITWIALGAIALIFLTCVIRNILVYRKDEELMNKITENLQETEFVNTMKNRNTLENRPIFPQNDEYASLGNGNTIENTSQNY